ncbi:MAG: minor capsid protein [Methanocorpusculum sp.]|nr:minor capsid protein [Methanocorpusculum sp.]
MAKPKKKNADYWKKRFGVLEEASNAYGQQAFQVIEPSFDSALRQIEGQIQAWYGRFAKNNQITMQEARKLLTAAELKEFRWDVQEYIKYGRENDLNGLWMQELENASAKYHISRLEALKVRTQQAAEVAFGNELDAVDAMARKVFTEDYYHSIFEIQRGFNVGWEIGQIDERKLEKLIAKPWAADGKHFSERIWDSRTQLVSELHNQLTRTCILGKAPDDAIKAISKKFNTSKKQAGRLVMTEQAYFHSEAQKEAFNDLDVEEFEIVATLDKDTSEICQEMDGKHFPMKDYEAGVTAPPFHPWCRSVTVPWFEDNFTGERAARDEEGKTYYVPDNMKYADWKKSMVDGQTDGLQEVDKNGIIKDKLPLKDKIQKVKDDIAANGGVITEDHIKEAGKAVQEEITSVRTPLKAKWDAAQADYDASDIKKQIDVWDAKRTELYDKKQSMSYFDPDRNAVIEEWEKAKSEYWKLYSSEEAQAFRKKISDAKKAYEGTWEDNAAELKDKLSQFRTVGVGSHDLKKEHYSGRGTLRDVVTTAYDHYPSDWVEASIKKGSLKISKVSRGFYDGHEIAISGYGTQSQVETAFHELGHRFEDVVKGIYEAEDIFYKRRTKGCPLEWLGTGYSRTERTRKDNFLHSYMGKEYPDNFYELVSMGFEYAYTNPTRLIQDEDFAQFIYGILSLY